MLRAQGIFTPVVSQSIIVAMKPARWRSRKSAIKDWPSFEAMHLNEKLGRRRWPFVLHHARRKDSGQRRLDCSTGCRIRPALACARRAFFTSQWADRNPVLTLGSLQERKRSRKIRIERPFIHVIAGCNTDSGSTSRSIFSAFS